MMDTMTMEDLAQYEDADTPETATETAEAAATEEPKKSRRRGRWVGPSAYSLIAEHLEKHGSITHETAKKLYEISYSSFHSTIYSLKHDGWLISAKKIREDGKSRTKYHVVDENETQEAEADSQPPTKKSNTVAVRIGENGLEVQLTAKDDMDTAPFYALSAKQIEYLATNFRLYQNLTGEK